MTFTCTQLDSGRFSQRSFVGQYSRFALRGDSHSLLAFSQRLRQGFTRLSSSGLHSGTTTRHMSIAMWGEQAVSTIWPICCRLKPWTPLGWRVEVYPNPRQKLVVTGLQLVRSFLVACTCWGKTCRHAKMKKKCFMLLRIRSVLFLNAVGSSVLQSVLLFLGGGERVCQSSF